MTISDLKIGDKILINQIKYIFLGKNNLKINNVFGSFYEFETLENDKLKKYFDSTKAVIKNNEIKVNTKEGTYEW
ncbi:hypothetical protein ACMGDK_11515 [Chryseobacterium sp. DT-3]|uniref:hypothetical protein n=1 Tax=Chryseobacterium sp. DT-3 TaxID=3396164 RepID=UPI003F1C97FD